MEKMSSAIPVVMYHTVGRSIPEWEWSFLTVPYKIFESHLQWLVKAGYKTVDLYELHAHVSGKMKLPRRSVVLTFDDGYLDNWGYVAPLLSKYGLKGTVFVNPEFVDPRDIIRPTIKDVWSGEIHENDVPVRGFMSWPELKLLADSGPLSIQSHAMSHTWYPTGNKIVDFHHPDDGIYWLDWNDHPEKKPFYLENLNKSNVAYGTPIYEHGKSLAVRRFFPSSKEVLKLADYVERNGKDEFFKQANWRKTLVAVAEGVRCHGVNQDVFETEQEQNERYLYELTESKKILEEQLETPMNFLCWPGGGYNKKSQEMALEIYSAVTLSSSDKSSVRNRAGEDESLIRRVGVPCLEEGGNVYYFNGNYFVLYLDEFMGSKLARWQRQILKLLKLVSVKCAVFFKETK